MAAPGSKIKVKAKAEAKGKAKSIGKSKSQSTAQAHSSHGAGGYSWWGFSLQDCFERKFARFCALTAQCLRVCNKLIANLITAETITATTITSGTLSLNQQYFLVGEHQEMFNYPVPDL